MAIYKTLDIKSKRVDENVNLQHNILISWYCEEVQLNI